MWKKNERSAYPLVKFLSRRQVKHLLSYNILINIGRPHRIECSRMMVPVRRMCWECTRGMRPAVCTHPPLANWNTVCTRKWSHWSCEVTTSISLIPAKLFILQSTTKPKKKEKDRYRSSLLRMRMLISRITTMIKISTQVLDSKMRRGRTFPTSYRPI